MWHTIKQNPSKLSSLWLFLVCLSHSNLFINHAIKGGKEKHRHYQNVKLYCCTTYWNYSKAYVLLHITGWKGIAGYSQRHCLSANDTLIRLIKLYLKYKVWLNCGFLKSEHQLSFETESCVASEYLMTITQGVCFLLLTVAT